MRRVLEAKSQLGRYLSEIGRHKILSRNQEIEVARSAMAGSEADRNKLIESNLSFVVKIANEYRGRGAPLEDLLSAGNVGLLQAAGRYDHTKGTRFISYAVWWVRKAILEALGEQAGMVRMPVYQRNKLRRVLQTESWLSRSLDRTPKREDISSILGISLAEIDRILTSRPREISMDCEPECEGISIKDRLEDPHSENPETMLLRKERLRLLGSALRVLTDQERRIIVKRTGLRGARPATLRELGDAMGLTRERIRQIEIGAKKKLRKFCDAAPAASLGQRRGRMSCASLESR